MQSVYEVFFHSRGVGSCADVVGVIFHDLALSMEECCSCAQDPSGEKSGVGGWDVVDGLSMVIGEDIDLHLRCEFHNGFFLS